MLADTSLAEVSRISEEKVRRAICRLTDFGYLRLLGPEQSETHFNVKALRRLREVEERVLAEVALRTRFESACASQPTIRLLNLNGWEVAEKELRLKAEWDETMLEAWHKHVHYCARYNNEPGLKEEWLAEMQFTFRPGLVG